MDNPVKVSKKLRDSKQSSEDPVSLDGAVNSKKSAKDRLKRKYTVLDENERIQLYKMVEEKGISIKQAAQDIGVNYSTAKYLIKMMRNKTQQEQDPASDVAPQHDDALPA